MQKSLFRKRNKKSIENKFPIRNISLLFWRQINFLSTSQDGAYDLLIFFGHSYIIKHLRKISSELLSEESLFWLSWFTPLTETTWLTESNQSV